MIMVFLDSVKEGRNPPVAAALWASRWTVLFRVRWGALTPATLSLCVMAAHKDEKKRYLNSISVMCSHGEYPQSQRRGYQQDLAWTCPLWCPYHFRAQSGSLGQNHLMETWFHKVRYFIFVLQKHASLEPKPFSWCEVITKETLNGTHSSWQWSGCSR